MLIVARLLQGAASALLAPSVFSITLVTFQEGAERNKALGILGAIAGAGAAIGVLLGGILTEYAGWEWVFWINVPIGVADAASSSRGSCSESSVEGLARNFDAFGAVTVTAQPAAAGLRAHPGQPGRLDLGADDRRARRLGGADGDLPGHRVAQPPRPDAAQLLQAAHADRARTSSASCSGTIVFSMFFLLSLYMQQVLGFSALETGVGYLAVALTAVVASGVAQALVTQDRASSRSWPSAWRDPRRA